ncbi:TRAP transporter small permease [Desulfocurvus vexinensis]|uniref:TRAP transporter small permease n=1 Tax=Desulfocurvus vexinensis TaxID=399548 RepID=UPI0004B09274|nr:TRAP transporter small permease [Desulfocurvus vexinensis]
MRPVAALLAASAVLDAACRPLTAALGAGMAGVIAAQVFWRYVLNDSLFWSEELGRILLIWLTFVGATVAYRQGAHLGVDSLVRRLPPRARAVADALAHLVCLALFAAMAGYGLGYVRLLAGQTTPALGWPAGLGAGAVPLAGAVLCVHALARLAGGRTPGTPDAPGGQTSPGTPGAPGAPESPGIPTPPRPPEAAP